MSRRGVAQKKRRRWLIAMIWAFFIFSAGFTITLYRTLRPEQFRAWISAAMDSAVQEGKFRFSEEIEIDWFRLAVAVRDVFLEGPGNEELLFARRVAIVPRLPALIAGRLEPRMVIIDGPSIRIIRRSDGSWNFDDELIREMISGLSQGTGRGVCPTIRLRAGRVTLRDEGRKSLRGEETSGSLEPLELDLTDIYFNCEDENGLMKFEGEVRHPLVRYFHVSGKWNWEENILSECLVRAAKVDLSGPVDRFLPEAAAKYVRSLSLNGFADIEKGVIHYDPEQGFVPLSVSGQLIRCRLSPPELPFPVKQLGGKFSVKGQRIECKELQGWFGAGRIRGEAAMNVDASGEIQLLELLAEADAIPLDSRFRALLDPPLVKIYDWFRPQGTIGIEIKLRGPSFPPSPENLEASVVLNGVQFAFQDFPYRFHDLTGEAILKEGQLELKSPLVAHNRDATLTITGHADLSSSLLWGGKKDSSPGELAFEMKVEKLPLDEEVREALPADARQLWDDFQPAGRAQITFTVQRGPGSSELTLAAFVIPLGVRISYAEFPYEITGITGLMNFNFQRKLLTLSSLKGNHEGQVVTAEGVIGLDKKGMFRIDLKSEDLRMDDDLKAAFSPGARELLDDFRFQGRAKTEVTIHSVDEGAVAVMVEVDLIEGEVNYVLFPYPLSLGGGHLSAIGEQALLFSNVVTREFRPDGSPERPRVSFQGEIGVHGGERIMSFDFDIEELDVDERLLKALPKELRMFVKNLGLEGTFRGQLSGNFTHSLDRPGKRRLVYQAKNVSARNAAVDFGLRLRRMEALGGFEGGRDENGNHYFHGDVNVRSAAFNRLVLKDADISYSFGQEHPIIEAIREEKPLSSEEYRPSPHLLDRLTGDQVKDAFQMLTRRSDLYGGNVQGFLVIDVGEKHDLAGEYVAEGVQVAKAAPDVFGITDAGITGESRGKVSFHGSTGDALSIQGEGDGFITNARLIRLPLFIGLMNLLYGEFSMDHYFKQLSLNFTIGEGKFHAPRTDGIVIRSEGIHLKGGGTLDFDGNLDLALVPELLRLKIPIVDQFLDLIKRGLVQVWISGDLASPKMSFVTAGGLIPVPIDATPTPPDRPLPRELREGDPLPPPPVPEPPEKRKSKSQ